MLTVDFETYWDKDFTLGKMTMAEYINDPRFQIIGLSVKRGDKRPEWFTGTHDEIREWAKQFDWDNHLCIAHNAMFDGAILEWVLGVKPYMYFCTMMASYPWVVPFTGRASLATVGRHLGIGVKGTEVSATKGVRREDFTPAQMQRFANYCIQDAELSYGVYKKLAKKTPDSECRVIDLTVKKFTRPVLKLNTDVLAARLDEIESDKARALVSIGLSSPKVLMSNNMLAAALRARGVQPPTKISATTGETTWAMSKSDADFMALVDHPKVGRLVQARLLWKSTIEESRIRKFIAVANCHDNQLAVPLLYSGARTLRFSGFDGLNLQNLTRGSVLREAIVAPEGYVLIAADLSQIEARMLATLAGQHDLVEAFRSGEDVYSSFASKLYGVEVNKDTHPAERFVGKVAILSLGYQAGAKKFRDTMATFGHPITEAEATRVVNTYRSTYGKITRFWDQTGYLLQCLKNNIPMELGPVSTKFETLCLPNKMEIYYPGLAYGGGRWSYLAYVGRSTPVRTDIYSGKLVENIVQALSRIVLTNAELRLADHRVRAALSVHDELVFVVPERSADKFALAIRKALTQTVPWLPELPVEAEVSIGRNYKECK